MDIKNMRATPKNIEEIYNVDLIMWAFEQGYELGALDIKNGVHVNFSETQKYFLSHLELFLKSKNKLEYVGT